MNKIYKIRKLTSLSSNQEIKCISRKAKHLGICYSIWLPLTKCGYLNLDLNEQTLNKIKSLVFVSLSHVSNSQ